jgi:hypothetical protein
MIRTRAHVLSAYLARSEAYQKLRDHVETLKWQANDFDVIPSVEEIEANVMDVMSAYDFPDDGELPIAPAIEARLEEQQILRKMVEEQAEILIRLKLLLDGTDVDAMIDFSEDEDSVLAYSRSVFNLQPDHSIAVAESGPYSRNATDFPDRARRLFRCVTAYVVEDEKGVRATIYRASLPALPAVLFISQHKLMRYLTSKVANLFPEEPVAIPQSDAEETDGVLAYFLDMLKLPQTTVVYLNGVEQFNTDMETEFFSKRCRRLYPYVQAYTLACDGVSNTVIYCIRLPDQPHIYYSSQGELSAFLSSDAAEWFEDAPVFDIKPVHYEEKRAAERAAFFLSRQHEYSLKHMVLDSVNKMTHVDPDIPDWMNSDDFMPAQYTSHVFTYREKDNGVVAKVCRHQPFGEHVRYSLV